MKINEKDYADVVSTIQKRKLNNFWSAFEFLISIGYSSIDSFSISLKHFGKDKLFESIAFIRSERKPLNPNDTYGFQYGFEYNLVVGLIKEHNKHLVDLYDSYLKIHLKACQSDMTFATPFEDLEKTCTVHNIYGLPMYIENYIIALAINHFDAKIEQNKTKY